MAKGWRNMKVPENMQTQDLPFDENFLQKKIDILTNTVNWLQKKADKWDKTVLAYHLVEQDDEFRRFIGDLLKEKESCSHH